MSDLWSALALGCEPLGGTDWGDTNLEELRKSVRVAVDRGISVFDTADVYGLGQSERELRLALGPDRHSVTIVTKGGLRWHDAGARRARVWRDCGAAYLTTAIDASLKRLGIDTIPVYLVHWPDPNTVLDETIECLERAKAAGKIRRFGLSNFPMDTALTRAADGSVSVIEAPISLLSERTTVAELVAARAQGIRTLTYGALAQGFLTGSYGPASVFAENDRRSRLPQFSEAGFARWRIVLEELTSIARETGRSAAQIALRWTLETGAATSVIVGAKTAQQVQEVCAVQDLKLTRTQIERLAVARDAVPSTNQEVP